MTAKTKSAGRQPAAAETTGGAAPAAAGSARRTRAKAPPQDTMGGLTRSLRSIAGQFVGMAGAAVDTSLHAASGLFPYGIASTKALVKAGGFLRNMREKAGMPLEELGTAIDLKDPSLLELAEDGKMALPFEVVLRLASVLARNDPVPFVMNLTKAYSPTLWTILETLGIGRLVEHAGREHEFVSIYRARDEARRLTDEEFQRVRKFVETAFDMALEFNREAKEVAARTATAKRPAKAGKGAG